MANFDGVVTLVTGAAQGIGAGIALRFAREGARVAVNARVDDARVAHVVEACNGVAAIADIADAAAVRRMVGDVEERVGPVEVLICNAARMTMCPFLAQSEEEWWDQVTINLTGHMELIAAVLPGMRHLGRGRIILVSSLWGIEGWPNATGYAATKSALISLGRSLGAELAPEGIAVSVVCPGIIDTPQLQVDADDAGITLTEMRSRYAATIPAGRIGKPADIAAACVLLAGPAGPAYAGQVVNPNGGEIRCSI